MSARSPHGAELLELFGVLAPAPLPTNVLTADDPVRACSTTLREETFDVAAALDELAAYSLISSASGAVVVHELVRCALAQRMDEAQTASARAWAIRLLSAAFPTTPTDPNTWAAATALVPHVLALFSTRTDDIDLLRLAVCAGHYLWARVVLNSAEDDRTLGVRWSDGSFRYRLPARAVATFRWE